MWSFFRRSRIRGGWNFLVVRKRRDVIMEAEFTHLCKWETCESTNVHSGIPHIHLHNGWSLCCSWIASFSLWTLASPIHLAVVESSRLEVLQIQTAMIHYFCDWCLIANILRFFSLLMRIFCLISSTETHSPTFPHENRIRMIRLANFGVIVVRFFIVTRSVNRRKTRPQSLLPMTNFETWMKNFSLNIFFLHKLLLIRNLRPSLVRELNVSEKGTIFYVSHNFPVSYP